MLERTRHAAFGALVCTLACTLPVQAQAAKRHHAAQPVAPVVELPQDAPSALPVRSAEAGPTVTLPPPTDKMPGITVSQARGLGILPSQGNSAAVVAQLSR